ncbi:DUF2157 domain-containing protein [Chitinophagaceae bacterium MMS25-I14]
MNLYTLKRLREGGFLTEEEYDRSSTYEQAKPLSVFWELRSLLYLGIILLTTGLGVLVYKNIDTIGHQAVLAFIAICCVGSFYYCIRHAKGYNRLKVESPNIWFDYILLLGCLLLISFITYLQFEYHVFGVHTGLASFIPMALLFIAAYYFDHLGILSLAITNLAAWAGITVTPLNILQDNDFSSSSVIYTGIVLGAGLIALAYVSERRHVKAHFAFTYKNFGINILFIASIAGMIMTENLYLLWFLPIAGLCFFSCRSALKESSFYFFVITTLYAYVVLSYVIIRLLFNASIDEGAIYLGLFYFIGSGIGLIRLLIHYNKKIKAHDSI